MPASPWSTRSKTQILNSVFFFLNMWQSNYLVLLELSIFLPNMKAPLLYFT